MEISIKSIKCKNGKIAHALCLNDVILTFDINTICKALDVPPSFITHVDGKEILTKC